MLWIVEYQLVRVGQVSGVGSGAGPCGTGGGAGLGEGEGAGMGSGTGGAVTDTGAGRPHPDAVAPTAKAAAAATPAASQARPLRFIRASLALLSQPGGVDYAVSGTAFFRWRAGGSARWRARGRR